MIGRIIDDTYEVKRVVGEGGFGVVYECVEKHLGRTVALKMMNVDKTGDWERKRFLSEGRNLASLNHPNVVQIFRLGTFEGSPYIVMEHLRGRTLKDLIRTERLPLKRALEIMRQVAAGLHAIHSAGILHHDLSLNNIMVPESGPTKILDLGLSRDLNALSTLSSQGRFVGTLAYVAPEQIEGKGSSFKAEIFSFGILLYEVLTGKNPFWAEHQMSLLYNIAHRTPDPVEALLPSCPRTLALLVDGCLEKRPEERPPSIGNVEQTLTAILESMDLQATTSIQIPQVAVLSRSTSRNPYLNRVMIKRRDEFFGRGQEIKRIFARLNASPPGSISIVGDRKIGKSSLLNYVYMRANRQLHLEEPEKMIMVFLDLQEEKGMSMESFVRKLLGIAILELRGRLDVSDCSLDLDGVKELVRRLDSGGFRLGILLDEFEAVTTNPNFDLEFFSFLRFLANHYDVAYLTSSARDLQTLCHTKEISDSPFFNIFTTMRLSTFSPSEAEELIRVPSARIEKPLEPYAAAILDMSGLFPFFLQMVCSHTLEWMDENPDKPGPDFVEIRRRFYEEARLHFRYIWEGFDQHERSAVLRVANGKGIPDALKHVLQELGAKHYLAEAGGRTRLFASTFEQFVKVEGMRDRKPSLLGRLLGRN